MISDRSVANRFPRLREWFRHHLSSLVATAVDFCCMVGVVELTGLSPVSGTVFGAAAGGITNYWLSRHWTYRSRSNSIQLELFRFALVSGASLGLNALGEHLFITSSDSHYVLGRILVATTVNNLWNYPMLRFFVFSERKAILEDAT
jgi:putative flippase GtrA